MNVLFVHQNFPGQFGNLARELHAQPGLSVRAIGREERARVAPVPCRGYSEAFLHTESNAHPYVRGFEQNVRRGQAVARIALELRAGGYEPAVIVGHCGWGDCLFLRDVFPRARQVVYPEFYYNPTGADLDFDPEFPTSLETKLNVRIRNATNLISLAAADFAWMPTRWQASLFPAEFRGKMQVIHDGIRTETAAPDPAAAFTVPGTGLALTRDDQVLTYVGRGLEPYRGFHVFMRALPEIMRANPRLQVLVAGEDRTAYGKRPKDGSYRTALLRELAGRLDERRLHFVGWISHPDYLRLLQVSSAHVYLTYPFVLSWSLLEALSCGCLVVGSRTPPVEEVIADGETGLLVDFFDPDGLAATVNEALGRLPELAHIRSAARRLAVERYDFRAVSLPRLRSLILGEPGPSGG